MGSYRATEGSTLPADFMEYKVHVDEQFVEAGRILAKSMQEKKSLERQHAQQRAAWQDELERARVAANRWTRPVGAIIRRPKLISDQEIEAEAFQVGFNGKTESAHEELPFAESEKHPPLYNNFPDQLRQMAVEILLQRSKVAYTLKDWNTMDSSSRQAYNLATYFKWEPYLARCAFWIGIALYHRKKWTEAYEAFEEADKTNGYYIARRIILHWLRETSKRLEGSPWSTGLSAIRGENPPVLTPLDTVVEEEDSFPFPDTGNPYRADQKDAPSNIGAPTEDESIHATETILLAYDPVPQRNAGSGEIGLGRNAQSRVVAASPKDQRVKPQLKAITLPSIVEPPRVRTPRLYEPQPSGGLSVSGTEELSSLEMGQSLATTSVSEPSVNTSQESQSATGEEYRVRPLDQPAFPEDLSGRGYRQPQSPTSLSPTLIAPSVDQYQSSPTANNPNGQDNDDSPSSYGSLDSPSPQEPSPNILLPISVLPSPAPTTALNTSPHQPQTPRASLPPKTSPPSPESSEHQRRRAALIAQRLLEDEEIEAAIRNVKAVASPRVASTKSASSRYSEAMWPKPINWSEKVNGLIGRSQSVRTTEGVGRRGRRPGPATRVSDSAVVTIAGTRMRVRERRTRMDWLDDQGADMSGEGESGASRDFDEREFPRFG